MHHRRHINGAAGRRRLHRHHRVRPHGHAIIGQGGGGLRQLHGRHQGVALTYADYHRFTLVPRLFKTAHFPLRGGQQAGVFTADVYARFSAKAKVTNKIGQPDYAQIQCQAIKKGVARNGNGFLHVHHAVAVRLPIPITVATIGQ